MSLKQYIILFLVLFLLPVVMGKTSIAPFAAFFQSPSWDNFWNALTSVLQQDWTFYMGWLAPWIEKIKEFLKQNLPTQIPTL